MPPQRETLLRTPATTASLLVRKLLMAAILVAATAVIVDAASSSAATSFATTSSSTSSSRWVMISVDLDGTANVVGSRIVEGGVESQCATAQELEAMNTMSHPDHYVEVSFTPPTSSSSGVANTGIVFPTCTIVTRDPRLTHYQQHRHRGSDHHEHHHDDHDHDDHEKNNQPASSLQKNSLALRLPEGVLELSVSAVDHLVKQHQTPAGAAKATTRTSFTFKTTALQLGEPHHELRRTATELGNTVVTIPTSQLAATALQEVGNPSETFNIVLVSSGYQGNEDKGYFDNYDTVEFLNFLRNATTTVATQPSPFDVYYSTFNIYSVWFSSDERGASKPSQGISVQNNLECSFGPTVTSNLACNNNKVLLAASYAPTDPQRTLIVVLVRDTWSGGSGGGGIAVYSTESDTLLSASNRLGIALHQIGHAWAGVSDEFSYGYDETMHVTMKNCYWQSYNTPWQAYTDNRVVRESQLGCSFNNYYGPTGGNCVMARTTYPSFCPVCKFFTLDALYSKGMKLVTPTYPHLDETMYVTVNTAANLYVNQYLPVMINGVDGTNRFRTTWTVIFAGNTFQVAFNTYTYQFNFSAPGTYVVNVTIEDRTTIILDQNRQAYETRGGNGPTATLQQYSFRVVNVANAASTGCSSKVATGFGTSYCAICDAGKTCTYSYLNTATPRLSATVYHADLDGLEVWMVAVGIVFVVVGIIIFVVAWRVMNAHQESNPVEILPLTDNIMIVRGVLIAVQILVLLIATFTIIYCVYQYGQLTVFGQSILLGVIACAVVVWLGSYLGVVAAYYKSRSLLFVNFILLLLLFGCVLLFSILLVYTLTNVNNSGVIDQLSSEWQSAVESRPYDVCQLENYMQCSGFNSSCAAFALTSPQGSTFCPSNCASNTNTNPCLSYIQDFVKSHFGSASAGGWVLTALLLAALILSVLLGCAIKNRRNNVHRERRVRHATGQNILLPEEIAMLRKEFNKIDKDGSGDISREEFSLFYNAVMGTDLSPRELEEYFDKLDADGNGNLSFEEFLKVYVPHREPRRKSMVKPKNVVEISSSSSSSDEDEKNAAAAAANKNRAAQYEQTSQSNGYDEEFAFEAPKKAASPPPQSGRSSNNGNLNISNQSSQQQAGRSPQPSNAGGRTPQAQPVDLRTSYQSSQPSQYQRAAAPPPRQDMMHNPGNRNTNNNNNNFYSNTSDLDLDIEMDDDFM